MLSRYKHVSELNSLDKIGLVTVYDDILERVVVELAATKSEDEIDHKLIREKFYDRLERLDEVVDTKTYTRYLPKK